MKTNVYWAWFLKCIYKCFSFFSEETKPSAKHPLFCDQSTEWAPFSPQHILLLGLCSSVPQKDNAVVCTVPRLAP